MAWGGTGGVGAYHAVVGKWVWVLKTGEDGLGIREGGVVGGKGGNEACGGEGVVNEAGFEHMGMGLGEFGGGFGHLCKG